jgi:hypothetical protein
MSDEASGPGEQWAVRRCPSCGAVSDGSLPHCPACGQTLAAAEGTPDIGKWVSAGWALFLRDIPIAVAIPLIVIVPTIGFLAAGYFGMIAMAIVSEHESSLPGRMPVILGVLAGTMVLTWGLAVPALQAGAYSCFLHGIRTGRLTADSLWAGFRRWWACTWVSCLLGGAAVLCLPFVFVLVGIPLLFGLFTLHWLSLFRIVDKGRGGVEALSFGCRVLSRRPWAMLVYSLLVFALMNAGVMGAYIGVFVSVPIGYGILAASYDSLSKEQELTA